METMKTYRSMRSNKSSMLCIILVAIVAAIVSSVSTYVIMHNEQQKGKLSTGTAFNNGYMLASDGPRSLNAVRSLNAEYVPIMSQDDPTWANKPYGGGTIGTHGCGLTSLAMALTYLRGEQVRPDDLADDSDGAFITAGINDMNKMCPWVVKNGYGVYWSGESWDLQDVEHWLDNGYVVMASVSGKIGERSYGSHIVLIYKRDANGWHIRDPKNMNNSLHVFTDEEVHTIKWGAFNGLGLGAIK